MRMRNSKHLVLVGRMGVSNATDSFFNRDVNCIRRFFRRRFRYEATSWPTWKDVLEIETGNAESAIQEKSNDDLTDLPETQKRVRIDLEVEASGFGRALQRELEDVSVHRETIFWLLCSGWINDNLFSLVYDRSARSSCK